MIRYCIREGIVRAALLTEYGWFTQDRSSGGYVWRLPRNTALYETHEEAHAALLARTSPEE